MNKKILVAALACCIVAAGILGYFYRLKTLPQEFPPPYEYEVYNVGDKIDLSGTAVENLGMENRDGYSITVSKVEEMTLKEYLDRYGNQDYEYKSFKELGDNSLKSIVCVTYVIENVSNTEGGIDLFGMTVVPLPDKDRFYLIDGDLYKTSERKLNDGDTDRPVQGASLVPGTTKETHVPYTNNGNPPEIYQKPVLGSDEYEILISGFPTKKVVIAKTQR